jgi:hypothetical protein
LKKAAEAKVEKKTLDAMKQKAREEKLLEGGFKNTLEVYIAELFDIMIEKPYVVVGAVVILLLSVYFLIPVRPAPADSVSSSNESDEDAGANEPTPTSDDQKVDETIAAAPDAAPAKSQKTKSKK